MAEYIEREAIQKRLNRIVEVNNLRTDRAWFTPYGVNALIEEIPAADVAPVVLCRDCVNYGEMLSGYDHRLICHKFALTTKPDDFCSRGERRNCGAMMRCAE